MLKHVPGMQVLGHMQEHMPSYVLKHEPEYVLKNVFKHVLRHVSEKHLPRDVIKRMANAVPMT